MSIRYFRLATIVWLANQGKFLIIFSSLQSQWNCFCLLCICQTSVRKLTRLKQKVQQQCHLISTETKIQGGNSKSWRRESVIIFEISIDSFWSRFYRFRACFHWGSHLTAKVKNSHWKNRYEIIHIQYCRVTGIFRFSSTLHGWYCAWYFFKIWY